MHFHKYQHHQEPLNCVFVRYKQCSVCNKVKVISMQPSHNFSGWSTVVTDLFYFGRYTGKGHAQIRTCQDCNLTEKRDI